MTVQVWIPGRWKSPNAFSGLMMVKHQQVVTAREKATLCLRGTLNGQRLPAKWKGPVRITFAGRRTRKLDAGDNLNSSFKAYRDSIIAELGLRSDADSSGNRFLYPPLTKPKRGEDEGVIVTIETLCAGRCGRAVETDGQRCSECEESSA